MQCELEFMKLMAQTDIVKNVEPIIYFLKFMVGILCTLFSFIWIANIS
jgi:hypothetical protein